MALSCISSQHSSYSDLQSFFDPSRLGFDFTTHTYNDPMEYNATMQNPPLQRSYSDGQQNSNVAVTAHTRFNDYEHVINFVDSPPNSKESWQDEQFSEVPKIIDVQTIYSSSLNRKRRMDWEALALSPNANNSNSNITNSTSPTPPKVANINSQAVVNVDEQKDRNEKKKSGRGNWADDIDFGEFDNNSYLNNESFLSFTPSLTVLKQEIPSPSHQADNISHLTKFGSNKSPQGHIIGSPDRNQAEPCDRQAENVSISSPQNITKSSGNYDGSAANNDSNVTTGLRELLPAENSPGSVQNSPRPVPESSKSELVSDDFKFQYILAAATSIATKNNEETLTYLNQGQSYEIKLKKTGDLSFYRDKILKSVIKICFHERRLQYMERAQMQQWQASRPGERIIEVDVPLSYGLCHVYQPTNSNLFNTVEILWDPMKEVGVYIKVNCISTEFTPKKHGGEKGVPFRIQIETYIENSSNTNSASNASPADNNISNNNNNQTATSTSTSGSANTKAIHAAACQIKVFKLKGADRKHKQDREKIQRRPQSEQDKYQPSYECTILNDIPLDSLTPTPGCYSPEYLKLWPNSPVHVPKYDGIFSSVPTTTNSSPIAINSVTSTNNSNLKIMDCNMVSPQQVDLEDYASTISKDSTPNQVSQWLVYHRLNAYVSTFAQYYGSDILRMSKEDLIQICGLADGIRMFNIIHANQETKRTIYISLDGNSFNAIYLKTTTVKELIQKILKLPGFYELCANQNINGGSTDVFSGWGMNSKYSGSGSNIYNDSSRLTIYITGPSGVHVLITDEVLINEVEDKSPYALDVQNGKVLMKLIKKIEN